jgi:hypothetical protein
MPRLYELLSREDQYDAAVRAKGPGQVARTFAEHVGQFPDRDAFDALARRVSDLYARRRSVDDALTFQAGLDRRLCDRYHSAVVWHVDGCAPGRAA